MKNLPIKADTETIEGIAILKFMITGTEKFMSTCYPIIEIPSTLSLVNLV